MTTPEKTPQALRGRRGCSGGFTLPELVLGIALLGMFLSFAIGVVLTAKRLLPGRSIALDGETLAVAPAPGVFGEAVRFHGALIQRLNEARAVYVFGGEHRGLPERASRLAGAPLAAATLPSLVLSRGSGLATDAFGFWKLHAATLGAPEVDAHPDDFTVLVMGPHDGQLAATALLQIRSKAVSLGGQSPGDAFVRREAVLHEITGQTWRYRFLERASTAAAISVGACHYWHRYDEERVAEEGAVMVVFPDPWLYAGRRGDTDRELHTYSRFAYALAVNP